MIGNKGPFPETNSAHEGFEENGYIGSSTAVGAGHESGDRPLDGGWDWPSQEPSGSGPGSGEGVKGDGHSIGTPSWLNE